MSKRKTEEVPQYPPAVSCDADLVDDGFVEQPSRKRVKVAESTSVHLVRAPRRSSTIVTTFNLCGHSSMVSLGSSSSSMLDCRHHSASSFGDISTSSSQRGETRMENDCREQPDESCMDQQQEMRDLTETMRDMVSY